MFFHQNHFISPTVLCQMVGHTYTDCTTADNHCPCICLHENVLLSLKRYCPLFRIFYLGLIDRSVWSLYGSEWLCDILMICFLC